MKTKEDVEKMYNFFGYFNDNQFIKQEYRQGVMDALSYVLNDYSKLDEFKKKFDKQIDILNKGCIDK